LILSAANLEISHETTKKNSRNSHINLLTSDISLRQFLMLVSPALAFSTIDYCWLLLFVKQDCNATLSKREPVPPFFISQSFITT